MKHLLSSLLSVAALIAYAQDYRLTESVVITGEAPVWTLTLSGGDSDGALYHIYGDTAVSESVDGSRKWWRIEGENMLYILDEDVLSRKDLCGGVRSVSPLRPKHKLPFGEKYMAEVVAEGGHHMKLRGENSVKVPAKGIVVANGDTVPVIMCEVENVEMPDSVMKHVTRRERWYRYNDELPCIVQTRYIVLDSVGRELRNDVTAYSLSPEELALDEASEKEPEVNITISDGSVAVECTAAFKVDITDASGIAFVRDIAGQAGQSVDIPTSHLPRGLYIVVVTAGDTVNKYPLRAG